MTTKLPKYFVEIPKKCPGCGSSDGVFYYNDVSKNTWVVKCGVIEIDVDYEKVGKCIKDRNADYGNHVLVKEVLDPHESDCGCVQTIYNNTGNKKCDFYYEESF